MFCKSPSCVSCFFGISQPRNSPVLLKLFCRKPIMRSVKINPDAFYSSKWVKIGSCFVKVHHVSYGFLAAPSYEMSPLCENWFAEAHNVSCEIISGVHQSRRFFVSKLGESGSCFAGFHDVSSFFFGCSQIRNVPFFAKVLKLTPVWHKRSPL